MVSLFDDYEVFCCICGKGLVIIKEHNHAIIQDLTAGGITKIYNLCNSCKEKVIKNIEEERQKCLVLK